MECDTDLEVCQKVSFLHDHGGCVVAMWRYRDVAGGTRRQGLFKRFSRRLADLHGGDITVW